LTPEKETKNGRIHFLVTESPFLRIASGLFKLGSSSLQAKARSKGDRLR